MGAHLWLREYFDRFARNDQDTEKWIRYTMNNPARAGLTDWPWVFPAPGDGSDARRATL